jgi:hypothetical protein
MPIGNKVRTFNCLEQYLMYSKAILFKDFKTSKLILKEHLPYRQKQLGRKVKHFKKQTWMKTVESILLKGVQTKFCQNKKILKYLLKTGSSSIVEASPWDHFYGAGIPLNDDQIWNPTLWGRNLLGSTLESVRDNYIKTT